MNSYSVNLTARIRYFLSEQVQVPPGYGLAEQDADPGCDGDCRAEGDSVFPADHGKNESNDAGQDQIEQSGYRSGEEPHHKEKLDVSASESFLAGGPVKEKGKQKQCPCNDGSAQKARDQLVFDFFPGEGKGNRPQHNSCRDEAVRNFKGIQVGQGKSEKDTGQDHVPNRENADPVSEIYTCEGAGENQLRDHVPRGNLLMAVPASALQEQVAEDRHQVRR